MNVNFPKTNNTLPKDLFSEIEKDCEFVEIEGGSYFRIERSGEMPPFLINLVSANNHWMFIGSNGALTAGRRDADNALFPYCAQDKLFELSNTVGSVSLLWVDRSGYETARLWEPFKAAKHGDAIQRSLYKNREGNKLIFEERNFDLGVSFRYLWSFSDLFGFARKAWIENLVEEPLRVRLLDGIQNLVPYGLNQAFTNQFSNLSDAYKKSELLPGGNLGVYYLSSIPTDRAEPSEGLRATVAWSVGIQSVSTLLSNKQVDAFRDGEALTTEWDSRGLRGAYLLESVIDLNAGEKADWWIVADINKDAAQVESLMSDLELNSARDRLEADIEKNILDLRLKVASADGLSLTSDKRRDSRHYSNTLFNIMRGGVFNDAYQLDLSDFFVYVKSRNQSVFSDFTDEMEAGFGGRENVGYDELVQWAIQSGDSRLTRLSREYLPLTFSRRHGDPSRPWNRFSIDTQDRFGKPILGYEGNWRDIFQNWEALAHSYPGFLEGMIMRFLNSTTADGYNPYRITRDGIDWETIEAESPWSNIGYWGDHQIIYLLKLLEASVQFHPDILPRILDDRAFVYAQVPYRIRSFEEIWRNPRETIDFSDEDAAKIDERCSGLGSDGKLLTGANAQIVEVNLLEKLLIPLLSKLSNFVPDGGIWMNTQRPEWNDANNALVGYGISMVTLCYVDRYIGFLLKLLGRETDGRVYSTSEEVAEFLTNQALAFHQFEQFLNVGFDSKSRMEMVRMLGLGGESFRNRLYENGFSGSRSNLSSKDIIEYLNRARKFVQTSIEANERPDGLYHSYNLIKASEEGGLELDRLSVMLEGQVAVLSSGHLSAEKAVRLLDALRSSSLYRKDVESYILYPDRELPTFLEKNVVAADSVRGNRLLTEMLARRDRRVILEDVAGHYRFNGDFRNSEDLKKELMKIRGEYSNLGGDEVLAKIESIFDECFDHRRFTGRSSTFFAYEGLGSVYWHMVSKLVLAIQENHEWAIMRGAADQTISSLANRYFETIKGLGLYREPRDYGAFPIDAYSHTPKHAGAQQPGMTGQVKEDILTRLSELGLKVRDGRILFEPRLLRKNDFLKEPAVFEYVDVFGNSKSLALGLGQLALTFCQTPFVMQIGDDWRIRIIITDGSELERDGEALLREESQSIFSRNATVSRVEVTLPESTLIIGN